MNDGLYLGYQARWSADASRVRVIEKSRRIGISWSTAGDSALEAAATSGMDQWYVGYNHDMASEFIGDAAEWSRAFQLAASEIDEVLIEDEDRDILAYQIRYASGYRVTALTSRPSNLRGKQGHAIIDEAAFHEDLAGLMKAALAFLMWGGRVSVISTHNGVDNAFNQLVEDIRAGRLRYSLHRVTLDDALAEGLYKRICERLGLKWTPEAEREWRDELVELYGDGADEELKCIPSKSGNVYIPRSLVEMRMFEAPVLRLDLPSEFAMRPEGARTAEVAAWCKEHLDPLLAKLLKDKLHFLGEDFGRVSDLTVLAPMFLEQTMRRRVPFLVELRNVPYDQQREVLFYLCDRLPRRTRIALDATGNGGYLAEVAGQRYGAVDDEGNGVVEAVPLSDKWYAEHLPPFKAAFEDNLIALPRDADVAQDISALRRVNGIPKLPKIKTGDEKGKTRHGDAAIALALGHYASRLPHERFGYRPVEITEERRAVKATRGFRAFKGGL